MDSITLEDVATIILLAVISGLAAYVWAKALDALLGD